MRTVLTDDKVNKGKITRSMCKIQINIRHTSRVTPRNANQKVRRCWFRLLRYMVKGGWVRGNSIKLVESQLEIEEPDYSFLYTNLGSAKYSEDDATP